MTGDLSVGVFQEHFQRIMNNQNAGGRRGNMYFLKIMLFKLKSSINIPPSLTS